MKQRSLLLGAVAFLVAWFALAEWQRREFVHQRASLRSSLEGQAESMIEAIASIVESHRWFGPFVQNELTAALERIAKSSNVLVVAIAQQEDILELSQSKRGVNLYSAGDAALIDESLTTGGQWTPQGYAIVHPFQLMTSPPHGRMGTAETQQHFGPGQLGGGPRWMTADPEIGNFEAILVLDRSPFDTQVGRELRNRTLLVGFGGLVLVCTAVAWLASVRLTQARGTTQVLQAEARHLRELGQAAAGLAHETRNPLGLVRGWAQRLVTTGLPTDQQQEQAEAMLEECDRVTARINQFLAFARPPTLKREPVLIREVLEQLRVLLEPDLDGCSVDVDFQGVNVDTKVYADREQLRQAIFNLLHNAIQFSPERGVITVRLCPRLGAKLRLEIQDEGPGVPADSIEKLFEPYITSRPEGTGLGLAIVRRIAVAHGWQVGFTSSAEGGSVFWLDDLTTCHGRGN